MREFKIIECKEITTKDGRTFTAYKTLAKGGKKMDVRFVRGCKNIPTGPCTIVVDDNDCNVDKSRLYPILWIKQVVEIKENEHKSNIDEFFGDDEERTAEEV